MTISMKDKIIWWVWWGVSGDALWLAVEKRTSDYILNVIGDITDYMPIKWNWFLEKEFEKPWFRYKPDDTWVISDDSIFTMAGMDSISEKWWIEIQHLFDTHKKLFDQYGWYWFGWDTRKRFEAYTWDITTLHNHSRANGIMMKMLPYSVWFSRIPVQEFMPFDVDTEMEKIISVTHDTPVAKITWLLHNKTLMYLLNSDPETFDPHAMLSYLLRISHHYEDRFIDESDALYTADTHMYISPIVKKLIAQQKAIQAWNPYSLQQILDTFIITLEDPIMNAKMKPWFHVASTFGLVYACFLQNQNFEWLLNSIRIWYDTDTQASIIGNMIWALTWPFYEQKYVDGIQDKEIIQKSLDRFINILELK